MKTSIFNKMRLFAGLLSLILLLSACVPGVVPVDSSEPATEPVSVESSSEALTTEPVTEPATTERQLLDPSELEPFDDYAAQFFVDYLGDDLSTWNSLTLDPANLGYEREEGLKAEFDMYDENYLTETIPETYQECDDELTILYSYDYDSLDEMQQNLYEAMEWVLLLNIEASRPDCEWSILTQADYISQYGGYIANFTSLVENYKYRKEQDIIDVIDYTLSTKDAFASYIKYLDDRIAMELPLSDFTLDKMDEYLDGIIEKGEDYYLFKVAENAIQKVTFLTEEQKNDYISQLHTALKDVFLEAVKSLREEVEKRKGYWTDPTEGYLTHYGKNGKEFYSWIMRLRLGLKKFDIKEYATTLYSEYQNGMVMWGEVQNKVKSYGSEFESQFNLALKSKKDFLGCSNPEELLDFLLEQSAYVVDPLPQVPEITVKYADETIAEFASFAAYYTLSPLDEPFSPVEYVTLNPNNKVLADLVFVMSHEGYPGHMYAHCMRKQAGMPAQLQMYNSLGGEEGWAQYAAYKTLMSYAERTIETDPLNALLAEYQAVYTYVNYIYSAYLDVLVNGQGYTVKRLVGSLKYSEDEAKEILHYVDEEIGGFAAYGYGFYQMVYHHSRAQRKVSTYSETEFNTYLMLHNGLYSLDRLAKVTNQYISEYKNR